MPMMLGFSDHRRQLLSEEAERLAEDLPPLGVLQAYLVGDFASERIRPETELDLVIVHQTEQPFHRRADFFASHLRPAVGARYVVYTPGEFEELQHVDPVLIRARESGRMIVGY